MMKLTKWESHKNPNAIGLTTGYEKLCLVCRSVNNKIY